MYMAEIGVVPEYRDQGYSMILRDKVSVMYNPDVIYGEAQNTVSVISRDRVYQNEYYTYWIQLPVKDNYPASRIVEELGIKCVTMFDPENASTYEEGVKRYTQFG